MSGDELKRLQLSFLARYAQMPTAGTRGTKPKPIPPRPPTVTTTPPHPTSAPSIRHNWLTTDQRLIFDLVNYLRQVDRAVTAEEIARDTGIDLQNSPELVESLKANPKVGIVDGQWYSYKPTHDITNKQELLALLSKRPEGIDTAELADCYKGIKEDVNVSIPLFVWLFTKSESTGTLSHWTNKNDPKSRDKSPNHLSL
jgi:hypothetical protein